MAEASGVSDPDRLADVLDPGFVAGLKDLTVDEVRERRDRALAEREYLSYLRRLVQVRYDLLSAERDRRRSGGESRPLVERLASVLSESGHPGSSRGEAVRTALREEDVDRADERANAILGPVGLSNPEALEEDQLSSAIETLDGEERAISAERLSVLRVHDRLQGELKRRFREDPASITREV